MASGMSVSPWSTKEFATTGAVSTYATVARADVRRAPDCRARQKVNKPSNPNSTGAHSARCSLCNGSDNAVIADSLNPGYARATSLIASLGQIEPLRTHSATIGRW